MSYLILGLIKILDNVILTAKSIATYKGQRFLSSILVIVSQLIFYLVIDQVINDNTLTTIIVLAIASGVGNWVAFLISDRFKRDDTWTNILTTSDNEDMIKLCSILKKKGIKYLLFNTFNRKHEESLTVMIFAKSKSESKLIDNYLEFTDAKYLRMINGIEVKSKNE